jgi:uncharacterized protein
MTENMGTSDITSDDKLWAALSYVISPIIPIIMLLMEEKKNRPFIRFHAVQALVVGIVVWIIASITCGFGGILWLVMLYWAFKAYQGADITIPLVTQFIKNQGWA